MNIILPNSRAHLQLVCVVEVHTYGRHHPGVEEGGQDALGDGVRDEVEVQWVAPVTWTNTQDGTSVSIFQSICPGSFQHVHKHTYAHIVIRSHADTLIWVEPVRQMHKSLCENTIYLHALLGISLPRTRSRFFTQKTESEIFGLRVCAAQILYFSFFCFSVCVSPILILFWKRPEGEEEQCYQQTPTHWKISTTRPMNCKVIPNQSEQASGYSLAHATILWMVDVAWGSPPPVDLFLPITKKQETGQYA